MYSQVAKSDSQVSPLQEYSFMPSWVKLPFSVQWNQCSLELLSEAERQLLLNANVKHAARFVPLRDAGQQIWTLSVHKDQSSRALPSKLQMVPSLSAANSSVPLVLLHGLGGGVGLWVLNLNAMSRYRNVYAIDLLGFGKSSRCHFSSNPGVAEIDWVESIEEWRVSMGLDSVYLLGHGLGGFLAGSYALRYPHRVRRLMLIEPWGVAERPSVLESEPKVLPLWVRALSAIARPFNPLISLRLAGPWAPNLIRRLRPDLGSKFASSSETSSDIIYDYIYQCNARSPATGETAFCTLSDSYGWAQNPLVTRIGRLPLTIPITVIHGARSWLDSGTGELIARARAAHLAALGTISASQPVDSWSPQAKLMSGRVDVHVLPQAGHHVYSDQASTFNDLINRILLDSDATPRTIKMK